MFRPIIKRTFINNQIRAKEIRLIDETGKQIGIFSVQKGIEMAKERGLDLIQVTKKIEPPVCRMGDYGKYLYREEKKKGRSKVEKRSEIKGIRLRFNISTHDLETRARQTEKFLKKGDNVKIEMILRGREKRLLEFSRQKINQFLEILEKIIPIKIERELKKESKGFTMIISHDTSLKT